MSKFKTGSIYASFKKHIQRNLKIFYPGSLKRIIPVILFMFCLHLIWIKVSAPAPCGDGQDRLYVPFSSYLRLASEKRFSHGFISTQSQDNCYPNGFAIISLLVNKSGLGPLFLKEPFYLTLLLLIPLSLIFALHPWKGRRVGLLCLLFFFFPPIQICLRSFSPHGFNVLLALGGIMLWIRAWNRNAPVAFLGGFGLLWLSAILKHLGLWLAIGFLFCFVFWSILRRKKIGTAIFLSLLFIVLCLPWYPKNVFTNYMISVSHHGKLSHILTALFAAIVTLSLVLLSAIITGRKKITTPPCLFSNGLLLSFYFGLGIFAGTTNFEMAGQGLNLPVSILIGSGYLFFLFLPAIYDLRSERGFFIILCYTSLLNAAIIYYSRFGYNIDVFYFPLCLALCMTMKEINKKSIMIGMALIFAVISNFTPPLSFFLDNNSRIAMLRYPHGWNTFHDHPLSWRKSELRPLKEELFRLMENLNFSPEEPEIYGFTRFMDGHLILQMAAFEPNWYLSFPDLKVLPEKITSELIGMSKKEEIEKVFNGCLQRNELSYIMVAEQSWSRDPLFCQKFDFYQASKKQITLTLSENNSNMSRDVECFFWDYLQKENRLAENFHLHPIGHPEPKLYLYLSKSISHKPDNNYLARRISNLHEKESRFFAQELFLESNQYFDAEDWEKSRELLLQTLEIQPDHAEARKDLEIVESRIRVSSDKRPGMTAAKAPMPE